MFYVAEESRCGLFPLQRHRIPLPGVQPRASGNDQVDFLDLDGAVEPVTGARFLLELPARNAPCFQGFLDEVAALDPESLLGLGVDNGRLHPAPSLTLPANVRVLFFPP